ncbi:MAG: hypothetical protein R3B09_17095, partial [Nannocystaceae bacterium]
EGVDWADALATLARAGVAALQGDPARAIDAYDAAARRLEAVDMRGWADAAAWRRARTRGGAAEEARAHALEEALAAQGVRRPGRFMAMLAPGMR